MADPAAASAERAISFGPFHLLPEQRLLLEGDRPVRLGSRAFEILVALTAHAGEVIGKDALIARAWPGTFVEESNLKFQVSALRRAIGDGHAGRRYIATLPGRGYSFVAPVAVAEGSSHPVVLPAAAEQAHNLPAALTRMVGRTDTVATLVGRLPRQRLVTIVGPGGVGKTTLALAVAERLIGAYEHGVWLIDLAPLGDPRLVPSALAAVLGLDIRSEDPLSGLVARLRDKRMLLVLDNCEHVIEAAASLADGILKGASGVHILATSREPLRVEGEHVYRLAPLASPPPSSRLGAAEAMGFPAVQLFVERAAAALNDFALSDAEAPLVAEICRKLDGLPLAIEFAAAYVEALGIRGLTARLDDHLRLPAGRRRTTMPRHRTLAAALDWSYGLLTEGERVILRHLAVFAGPFSLDAAGAVAANPPEISAWEVVEDLSSLVAKSLVAAEAAGAEIRFRLLETTRAYALQKLAESGELEAVTRRHAEHYRDVFERAETEWERRPTAEWLADYGPKVDDLRAALDWAFSPGGDASIGAALTAAAVPLWMQLSLVEECRRRVEQAFGAVAADVEVDARREMKLHAALGASLIYTGGGGHDVAAVWNRVLEIAESLDDAEYQMLSLWGLWAFYVNGIQYRTALMLARRFSSLATTRPNPIPGTPALGGRPSGDRLVGERMIALSYHFLGEQPGARRHIERALPRSAAPDGKHKIIRLELDPLVTARVHLARILWLQGLPDHAMREAEQSIEDARTAQHAISFNYALHRGACPIALWTGDLSAAGRYADILFDHAKSHALGRWQLYGRGYQGAVAIRRGDIATGLRLLRAAFRELGETGIAAPRFMRFAAVYMAEALGQAGQTSDGLVAIDDAIGRAERTNELWEFPELMRIKGELLLLQGASRAAATAEDHFRRALDRARRQGALSWELRAATSLARLLRDQGRSAEARQLLGSVYGRFTEGFGTADLLAARRLIDELT